LRGGQVFVAVEREVKRAKAVAQPVAAGWDFERLTQPDKRPHIDVNPGGLVPYAACHSPKRFQPCGQRRANLNEAAAACLCVLRGDFDMAGDAKHVFPCQAQCFLKAKAGQPLQGDYGANRAFRRFEQAAQFIGPVEVGRAVSSCSICIASASIKRWVGER